MARSEIIATILLVALASVLVRLLIVNPAFGSQVNKVSAALF